MTAKEKSSVSDFKVDLNRLADVLDANVEEVHQKIVFDLHAGVTFRNPVLTGRSRANWQIDIGSLPNRSLPPERTDGDKSFIQSEIIRQQAKISQVSLDNKTFITNNLPYIPRLENGSSSQSPNGMVAVTMAEVKSGVDVAAGLGISN